MQSVPRSRIISKNHFAGPKKGVTTFEYMTLMTAIYQVKYFQEGGLKPPYI